MFPDSATVIPTLILSLYLHLGFQGRIFTSQFTLIFYILNSSYMLHEDYLINLPKIYLVNGKI